MQNPPNNIKGLSVRYQINLDKLYYLSSKKNYSIDEIKKKIFEKKYGSGNHYKNYLDYYTRILTATDNEFKKLKYDFFTDYKLSGELTLENIEQIWERIMQMFLKM